MKIVVCGSMTNYLKMIPIKEELEDLGHEVVLPDPAKSQHLKAIRDNSYEDTYMLKRRYDYIRRHYSHILDADCILIANWDKKGIKNYVGGNAFLEMGFAHVLDKPVYLLNPVPRIDYYYNEMKAIETKVLNGNLRKIA